MNSHTLSTEDADLMLTQVNRLALGNLRTLWQSEGTEPGPDWRRQWRSECAAVGLLVENPAAADPDAETDLSLWSDFLGSFSVQLLRVLSSWDAGAALQLHRDALAQQLCRRLGLSGAQSAQLVLSGGLGLGRSGLASWVSLQCFDAQDCAELSDNWGVATSRLLVAGDWSQVLLPVWRNNEFYWYRVDQTACATLDVHPHAFGQLGVWAVQPACGECIAEIDSSHLVQLLVRECSGLLGILAGLVDRVLDLSLAYAGQRHQGGRLIREWPAVQGLIVSIRTTVDQMDDALNQPIIDSPSGLAGQFRRYVMLSSLACQACNNAMQIHGGNGYMRDYPIERPVREANVLRRLLGPTAWLLLLSEQLDAV